MESEIPFITREMSVEVAEGLTAELKDILMATSYDAPHTTALYADLRQVLAQLKDQA